MTKDVVPSCGTLEQLEMWKRAARASRRADAAVAGTRTPDTVDFCADCTVRYAERMQAEGRCTPPGVVWLYDVKGDVWHRHATRAEGPQNEGSKTCGRMLPVRDVV